MCTPNLRNRLAATNAGVNPASANGMAVPPPRNLGVTLAAFPGATTSPLRPPGITNDRPVAANDATAQQRIPPRPAPSDRAPTPPAAQDRLDAIMRQLQAAQSRQGVTGPTIESADAARPLPSPPATTSPGGNASLDAIMQKIRPEPSSARNIADASRGPRPSPSQAPAATVQKRQVAGVPGGVSNAAPNASTSPAPPRQWPVPGYGGAADGTPSKGGAKGPNGIAFYANGAFDPTGAKGVRNGRRHQGVDLPAKEGKAVQAADDGVVVHIEPEKGWLKYRTTDKKGNVVHPYLMKPKKDKAGNLVYDQHGRPIMEHVIGLTGYGNRIWIDHADGTRTTYNHLQTPPGLPLGAHVRRGQVIGQVGTTGNAAGGGSHLHFEVRRYDRKARMWVPIDPAGWINGTP